MSLIARGRIVRCFLAFKPVSRTRNSPVPTDLELFGQRVRDLRGERGISQEQLAHTAGIDRSYLGGVERGERNIALRNIMKIAGALEVPAGQLLTWHKGTRRSSKNVHGNAGFDPQDQAT